MRPQQPQSNLPSLRPYRSTRAGNGGATGGDFGRSSCGRGYRDLAAEPHGELRPLSPSDAWQHVAMNGKRLRYRPGARSPRCPRTSVSTCTESPHGKGYQIIYEEDGVVHSVGHGPEAADRTFTIEFPKPVPSATSTPAIQ